MLLLAVAVAVLVGRLAAAVRGGPVVLPPEDARLLLTWPVPRRALVLPALVAALSRALAAARARQPRAAVRRRARRSGRPGRAVARDDLLLPALLALAVILLAWLVQVAPRLAPVGPRWPGPWSRSRGLVALGVLGRRLAVDGPLSALRSVAAHEPAGLPMSGAADGSAPPAGLRVAVGLVVLLVPLVLLRCGPPTGSPPSGCSGARAARTSPVPPCGWGSRRRST